MQIDTRYYSNANIVQSLSNSLEIVYHCLEIVSHKQDINKLFNIINIIIINITIIEACWWNWIIDRKWSWSSLNCQQTEFQGLQSIVWCCNARVYGIRSRFCDIVNIFMWVISLLVDKSHMITRNLMTTWHSRAFGTEIH